MAQLLFENARLLDVEAGALRDGVSVRVEDERIVEVSERAVAAPGARRVDLAGRTLMPGLIDAHVHCAITTMNLAAMTTKPATLVAHEAGRILSGMLRRGFTTVRDAGGADWGLAQAVERGLVEGPRLFFSGRVLSQTGGHGDFTPREDAPRLCACQIQSTGFSHVADGVAAVRKAAREELRRGATQVKIMASGGVASPSDPIWNLQYSAEEMRAIVEEAAGWRTYAMAHAYTPEAITRGILNSSLVHPREVFICAILARAAAVILCHNHPSGDPTPSADDRNVTDQLVAAGRMLDIPVHDHVVIGRGRYTSFAEAGLL